MTTHPTYPLSADDQLMLIRSGWTLYRFSPKGGRCEWIDRHEEQIIHRWFTSETDRWATLARVNAEPMHLIAEVDWRLTPASELKLMEAGHHLIRRQHGRLWKLYRTTHGLAYSPISRLPEKYIAV